MKTNFFDYVDFSLQFGPAGPQAQEIRAKLASIGISPGKTFDFKDLSPEHKAAVPWMKEGDEKVDHAAAELGTRINGWNVNGNWLSHAADARPHLRPRRHQGSA